MEVGTACPRGDDEELVDSEERTRDGGGCTELASRQGDDEGGAVDPVEKVGDGGVEVALAGGGACVAGHNSDDGYSGGRVGVYARVVGAIEESNVTCGIQWSIGLINVIKSGDMSYEQ